jgi:Helix-turn-helix
MMQARPSPSAHASFLERLDAMAKGFGSRAALAKAAGIPPGSLHNYIAGSEPTRPVLIALARAAKVSLTWFAAGEGSKEPGAPPFGYVGIPFYDLKKTAGRVLQPLLSETVAEFLLFKAERLGVETGAHLFAVEALEGFGARVNAGDLLVIQAPPIRLDLMCGLDTAPDPSSLDERAVCLVAHKGEARLRRLSWRDRHRHYYLVIGAPDAKDLEVELSSPEFFDFQLLGRVIWRAGRP